MPHNLHPEQEPQEKNVVQEQVEKKSKKLLRDRALKVGKAAGKAIARVSAKVILSIGKTLIGFLVGLGAPYLLLIGGILVGVIMIFLGTSMFFSEDPKSLTPEGRELRNHIIMEADRTVDMTRPEQVPYRVPHELIIVAMQIYDSDGLVKSKAAATQLAQALRPLFDYETRRGEIEAHTTTCVDGSCSTSTVITEFEVEFLVRVEAWDRIMTAEVKTEKTPWETATSSRTTTSTDEDGNTTSSTTTITTKTRADFYWSEEQVAYDYTLFERELSKKPFKYEEDSKKTVEAIYEIIGGEIYYSEWLAGESIIAGGGGNGFDGTITPGAGVPPEYMQYYLEAEKKYGVDWYYLASIHFNETRFSTSPTMKSNMGAEGHMQFLPCTWVGWSYPGCKGLGGTSIPDSTKTSPAAIKQYGGYGVDADGDGKADPFNVKDAIFATANYLSASGFRTNINNAIRIYNHSDAYVAAVVKKAKEFKDAATYTPNGGGPTNPGGFASPTPGQTLYMTYGVGMRQYAGSSKWTPHHGIDVHTRPRDKWGVAMSAIADGTVYQTERNCPRMGSSSSRCGSGFGNHVRIKHVVNGRVYDTIYAHFDAVGVSTGQQVKQGQYLGTMGSSGTSTRMHLHLEMYDGPRRADRSNLLHPNNYIKVIPTM